MLHFLICSGLVCVCVCWLKSEHVTTQHDGKQVKTHANKSSRKMTKGCNTQINISTCRSTPCFLQTLCFINWMHWENAHGKLPVTLFAVAMQPLTHPEEGGDLIYICWNICVCVCVCVLCESSFTFKYFQAVHRTFSDSRSFCMYYLDSFL